MDTPLAYLSWKIRAFEGFLTFSGEIHYLSSRDCQPIILTIGTTGSSGQAVWPKLPEYIKVAVKALVNIYLQGASQ